MAERQLTRPLSALQRLAAEGTRGAEAAQERCELCSEGIPPDHRHLWDTSARAVVCVCRACAILFNRGAAGGGRYKMVPDRRLALEEFSLSESEWESLRIPVGIAFFVAGTAPGVRVFYPSPAGPIESVVEGTTWARLRQRHPILDRMEPEVEALLVNRARGARQYVLVPIDECYRLVAVIRLRWRGLSGGQEVWKEIGHYFELLRQRCRPVASGIQHRRPAEEPTRMEGGTW